jgi:hypothetical protein
MGSAIVDGGVTWESITVAFGDQGTGTITAFPVFAAFPSQGWHVADPNGDPIYTGTSFPQIYPGHDFDYLTKNSGFTLPYNSASGFLTTQHTLTPFLPNTNMPGIQWAMAASGDGASDQRIGYMSNYGVASLYNPADPFYLRVTIQGALSFSQLNVSYMNDETTGRPFVGNNGHANSGVQYPNIPTTLIPAWNGGNVAGSPAKGIAARGAAWSGWSQANKDQGGYGGQYYPTTTGAHKPLPQQIAYLKTARPCFLELAIQNANTQCFAGYQGKQTLGTTTYYCLINGNYAACQLRAWAWSWRDLTQTLFMTPDDHVFKPVLADYYDDNITYHAAKLATFPAAQQTFGWLNVLDHGATNTKGHISPWMLFFLFFVVGMEVKRRGQTPNSGAKFDTLLDYMGKHWKLYDPAVSPDAINYIGSYDVVYSPLSIGSGGAAQCYTTADAVWQASFADGAVDGPPYIPYLYDQNQNPSHHLQQNFPANCNVYAVMGRAALTLHASVRPTDTYISGLRDELIKRLSAATGQPISKGGTQAVGPLAGFNENFQTFAVYP